MKPVYLRVMMLLRYLAFILLSFSYLNSTIIHKSSFEFIGLAAYVEEADVFFDNIIPIDWTMDLVGQDDEQNAPTHEEYRTKSPYELLGHTAPAYIPTSFNLSFFYTIKEKVTIFTQQVALLDIGYISYLARLYPF